MNNNDLIKAVFMPLMHEYKFSLIKDTYSPEYMGNSEVVFFSNKTGIRIVVDRSQVILTISSSLQNEEKWFEFEDLIHYFAPRMKGVYLFQRSEKKLNDVSSQARWILKIMRNYCEPLLNGDFIDYDRVKEIERKRVNELIETYKMLHVVI